MKKLHSILFMLGGFFMACQNNTEEASYQIVPLPQSVTMTNHTPFELNGKTAILYPENNELLKRNAEFLAEYLKESTGKSYQTGVLENGQPKNAIVLNINPDILNPEGYVLIVEPELVQINGQTESGVFYGIQTLRKVIPAVAKKDISLPTTHIEDYPRFGYRGMHLDVARHFFPVEFVKKYIDMLALHNMNTFHWHLTEDQGWRIEIKKYPKLTEVGSKRARTVIGKNTGVYDETPYGGYYTQEEVKEIVRYAQERYITVIPEIDLPGHMLAALTAYPQFGCTGGPYKVAETWGVFDDVLCIGNEDAMKFLEDVLDEVTELFPAKYVHIGGDEAPRVRWKTCPKCQALIRREHLKADARHSAEDRLQSYCTSRIEKFLNDKGRSIIGWDEILEGDIAPNATVMSWRGMKGGIEAAKLGHDVIMTPNSHLYFDHYQTKDTKDEELSIGGYSSVEHVYSLDPLPAELTDAEKKHIIGVQANIWTEYMKTPQRVEYMALPRMAALAEVQWTVPEKKNYQEFVPRLFRMIELYEREGYNYAKHIFDVTVNITSKTEDGMIEVTLSTVDNAPIYYTLNGEEPTTSSSKYEAPLQLKESASFRAKAIRALNSSKTTSEEIVYNKATAKPITLLTPPSKQYTFAGATTLNDGLTGAANYSTGRWLGFLGNGMEAVIDLGDPVSIRKVSTQTIVNLHDWIMGATGLTVSVSDDNQSFREIASKTFPDETDIHKLGIERYEVEFSPVTAHYVKVFLKSSPQLPKAHPGHGKQPFLFVDEINIQ